MSSTAIAGTEHFPNLARVLLNSFDSERYDFLDFGVPPGVDRKAVAAEFREECADVWRAILKVTGIMWDDGWQHTGDWPERDCGKEIFTAGNYLLADTCWIDSFRQVLVEAAPYMYPELDSEDRQFALFALAVLTAERAHWSTECRKESTRGTSC